MKVQSRFGVTVPKVQDTPFIQIYKPSQTFIEGSGYTKFNPGSEREVIKNNGWFIEDYINKNFTATSNGFWEINYSGFLEFEPDITDQSINIAVYRDDIIIRFSRLTITASDINQKYNFSRSFIYEIQANSAYDLRFEAVVGDITAVDIVFSIKYINYTADTQSLFE